MNYQDYFYFYFLLEMEYWRTVKIEKESYSIGNIYIYI